MFGPDSEIVELNANNKPVLVKAKDRIVKNLAGYINEDSACSACYSALIFALHHMPKLDKRLKINIGQGFRGKSGRLGCGNCTSGCEEFVMGCPPKAVDIIRFLNRVSN